MRRRDVCVGIAAGLLMFPCLGRGQTRGGRRDSVPDINWSWGPNRGLIWAVLFHPHLMRVGTLVDLVRQRNGAISNFASPPTATSGVAFTTSRRGGFGESRWSAAGEHIDFTDVQLPVGGTAYSVSLWMRTTQTGQSKYLWSYGTAAAQQERSLQITAGNVARHGTFGGDIDSTITVTDGNWYQIAGTIGPSTVNALYINGALQNSGTITAVNTVLNGTMRMGFSPNNAVPFQGGSLDDVRVWNRALSAAEMRAVYLDSLRGYPHYLVPEALGSHRSVATGRPRAKSRIF